MKTNTTLPLLAAVLLLPSTYCLGQGNLNPPGAPAPTMKSLQEIWNKIGTLETQNTALQNSANSQQQQIASLQKDSAAMSLLLDNAGIVFPWTLTTVDNTGNVGSFTSLAFTPGGQPAISYYDTTNGNLKYAVFNGSTWTLTTVDSTGYVCEYTSLAFTPGGQPAISYWDSSNLDLKYAVFNGSTWTLTTVDSSGNVGAYTSLAFTPGGQPAISYWDSTNYDLKYAIFNGSTWTRTTVDSTGLVGWYTSLAFTPGGQPAISYFDNTNWDLKFAIRKPFVSP
jgi:hypothetical protein